VAEQVPCSIQWAGVAEEAREALEHHDVFVLATSTTGPGVERPGDVRAPVEALASVAASLLRSNPSIGVVASGGDTVAALCRELGGGLLELRDEILPGLPRARLLDGELPGLPIVTKAGGFGPLEALAQAVRRLQGAG
jgi:uncharacterized protein YgbK (DUF1537 family)